MGGEHDRDALGVELADIVPQLAAKLDVDARRSARRAPGSAANGPSPWRPAAAASCRPTRCANRHWPCRSGASRRAARRSSGRPAATPYSPAWISSVSRGVKKGSKMISCGTTPIARLALRGCSSTSKPQMFTLPPRLHDQPGEDVDQGRLARAVGAEQPENLAARDVEADIVQRELAAGIGFGQRFDADGGLVHGAARHRSGSNQRQAFKVNRAVYPNRQSDFQVNPISARAVMTGPSLVRRASALLPLLLSAAAGGRAGAGLEQRDGAPSASFGH